MLSTQSNEFTQYVRLLARGRNGSRDLSQEEAFAAMTLLLNDVALPEQIGAFFMLMRVKEETSEELTGFAQACYPLWQFKDSNNQVQNLTADIIWPSYAGKRRQPLWFVLAMQLVRDAGFSILAHGASGHISAGSEDGSRQYLEQVFEHFALPIAHSKQQTQQQIDHHGISYLPCQVLHKNILNWLMSKQTLGLRSPINTLVRLIAPKGAMGVQSVFHPSYAQVHQNTCQALAKNAIIIKGEGGEFETNPERKIRAFEHLDGELALHEITHQKPHYDHKESKPSIQALVDLWQSNDGEQQQPYGYLAVIHTTALALKLGHSKKQPEITIEQCLEQAKLLWQKRDLSLFNK